MESDSRCVVRLLCARDRRETIRLEWLIRDQRGDTEHRTGASCQCEAEAEAFTQAVEARIAEDGSLEFFGECLE